MKFIIGSMNVDTLVSWLLEQPDQGGAGAMGLSSVWGSLDIGGGSLSYNGAGPGSESSDSSIDALSDSDSFSEETAGASNVINQRIATSVQNSRARGKFNLMFIILVKDSHFYLCAIKIFIANVYFNSFTYSLWKCPYRDKLFLRGINEGVLYLIQINLHLINILI